MPLDMYDAGTMAPKPFRRAKRLPRFKPAAGRMRGGSSAAAALGVAAAFPGCGPTPPGLGKLTFPEFAPALQQLQAAARTDARAATAARQAQQSAFGPHTEEDTAGLDMDGGLDVDGGDFGGDEGDHPAD